MQVHRKGRSNVQARGYDKGHDAKGLDTGDGEDRLFDLEANTVDIETYLDRPGRRGRPCSKNPQRYKTVGITEEQWQWLERWRPGGSPSDQLRELLDRAMKFWPGGPAVFR